jgi:hypothetical protein
MTLTSKCAACQGAKCVDLVAFVPSGSTTRFVGVGMRYIRLIHPPKERSIAVSPMP